MTSFIALTDLHLGTIKVGKSPPLDSLHGNHAAAIHAAIIDYAHSMETPLLINMGDTVTYSPDSDEYHCRLKTAQSLTKEFAGTYARCFGNHEAVPHPEDYGFIPQTHHVTSQAFDKTNVLILQSKVTWHGSLPAFSTPLNALQNALKECDQPNILVAYHFSLLDKLAHRYHSAITKPFNDAKESRLAREMISRKSMEGHKITVLNGDLHDYDHNTDGNVSYTTVPSAVLADRVNPEKPCAIFAEGREINGELTIKFKAITFHEGKKYSVRSLTKSEINLYKHKTLELVAA